HGIKPLQANRACDRASRQSIRAPVAPNDPHGHYSPSWRVRLVDDAILNPAHALDALNVLFPYRAGALDSAPRPKRELRPSAPRPNQNEATSSPPFPPT